MACHHPFRMWRHDGKVTLRRPESDDREAMDMPCGGCLGCRMDRARSWAIRNRLELANHEKACWTTLTYSDENLPAYRSIRRDHLSGYIKRLRARLSSEKIRFFGCGEYGERGGRPHYHAILYGIDGTESSIRKAWPFGHVGVHALTPAAIKYVAGYCAKKEGWYGEFREVLDERTGELYGREAPFLLMSRRPGIGGEARKHWQSWSRYAVMDGTKFPVPRYLHEAFKKEADPQYVEEVQFERWKHRKALTRDELDASEAVAKARLSLQSSRRTYG